MTAEKRPELLDYRDISEMTGQSVNFLHVLYARGVLPEKAHHRASVWLKADIEHWIRTDPRATPIRKKKVLENSR